MATATTRRLAIFLGLALVMGVTRIHPSLLHHALWDASWGVFFLAGFWLRGQGRWAFPLLMAEAVLADYFVITGQGMNFWSHYCVSPGYWFLLPAYGALWLGGRWYAARHRSGLGLERASLLGLAVVASSSAAFLISNGSFYLFSGRVEALTWSGYVAQLAEYYPPYVAVAAAYVAVVAMVHTLVATLGGDVGKSVARG